MKDQETTAIDASSADLLQILQQHADQCTLRLAKADFPPIPTVDTVTEADFPGYRRQQLAAWTRDNSISAAIGAALSKSSLWEKTAAESPQQIYGGYVVWQSVDAAASLVAFCRFATPQRMELKNANLLVGWLLEVVALVDLDAPVWVSLLSGAPIAA